MLHYFLKSLLNTLTAIGFLFQGQLSLTHFMVVRTVSSQRNIDSNGPASNLWSWGFKIQICRDLVVHSWGSSTFPKSVWLAPNWKVSNFCHFKKKIKNVLNMSFGRFWNRLKILFSSFWVCKWGFKQLLFQHF